jgi:tetratricopeptide (TPR) repeat protein
MTARAFLAILLVGFCASFVTSSAQVGPYRHKNSGGGTTQTVEQESEHWMPPSNDTNYDRQSAVSAVELTIPSKARDALRRALAAIKKHNLEDAARFAEKALTYCPKFAEALALRAMLESQHTNSMQQAKADAENAVKYDSNYGIGYVVLGSIYNYYKQFDDAERTLDRGIALTPAEWQGYYEMSIALMGKGDFVGALHEAERASKLNSQNFPDLHLVKAYAYIGLKNRSAATSELEAVRGLDSQNHCLAEAEQAFKNAFPSNDSEVQRP